MPFSKTEGGRGVRIGVGEGLGGMVDTGVNCKGMVVGSLEAVAAIGADWEGLAVGSVVG